MKLKDKLTDLLYGTGKEDRLIEDIKQIIASGKDENAFVELQKTYKKLMSLYFVDSAVKLSEKTGVTPCIDEDFEKIVSVLYNKLVPKLEMSAVESIYKFTKIKPNFSREQIEKICTGEDAEKFSEYAERLKVLMKN